MPREAIYLECTVCGNRNYRSTNKGGAGAVKVALKKYCKFCRKHTDHKEKKK